jgi:hypothetical protein
MSHVALQDVCKKCWRSSDGNDEQGRHCHGAEQRDLGKLFDNDPLTLVSTRVAKERDACCGYSARCGKRKSGKKDSLKGNHAVLH